MYLTYKDINVRDLLKSSSGRVWEVVDIDSGSVELYCAEIDQSQLISDVTFNRYRFKKVKNVTMGR